MTEEQKAKFDKALSTGTWPLMTDDPEVNYEIDRHTCDKDDPVFAGDPEWADLTEDQQEMYRREAVELA